MCPVLVFIEKLSYEDCDELCCFQRLSVLYTRGLFQIADGKMAESRMGNEEAYIDCGAPPE